MRNRKLTLAILLLSGFIDYAGVAIVYPLLAYLLFDPHFHFLPIDASITVRGLWLGILIALHPLFQFFFSPIFGSLSDLRGRKRLLILTFWVSLFGYGLAIFGMHYQNLLLIALFRIFTGIGGGNCSIVSAITADISTHENKAKHFGLLNMSFGAGFTLGPFLGGVMGESFGLTAPFVTAFILVLINLLLVQWKLAETRSVFIPGRVRFFSSFYQIREAARMPELRFIFLGLMIFSLGWSFFTEFVPLFLIDRYQFNPAQIGAYYGYTGAFYSLSAGLLIYPITRRLGIQRALVISMLFSGIYLLLFLKIDSSLLLWLYLPLLQFFLAFAYPAIAALISNKVSDERQGEVMGIYQSVIALALTITPFCSGSLVGSYPFLTVLVSGVLMASAACTVMLQRERAALDAD
ncbi:MAG: MFS transporter [Chlamydiales bacterium]|nr:MFS transporter [Chlamydiales bacterium]